MDDMEMDHGTSVQRVARSWSSEDWNRKRERSHRAYALQVQGIADATANGNRLNRAVRKFLRDPEVRLSAALRVLEGDPSPQDAFALRNAVNCWGQSFPVVTWYPKPKSSGGFRPICILPDALKATHYMLASVIGALLPPTETLFGVPGRGSAEALLELKALQNSGFRHLAKTDIISCYQSVNPDSLYQLPLPEEVIRRTLDHRQMTFTRDRYRGLSQGSYRTSSLRLSRLHNASGPSGLLQGSPASAIILAWLLKGIPTSENARVMMCFDNIVVAARTAHESREMMETLTAYFTASPAGPLALCAPTYADNSPLEFVGGRFDPARLDIDIASDTLSKVELRIGKAEEADQMHQAGVLAEHRKRAAENAIFRSIDPFINDFPAGIWQALKDTAAGLPFLAPDSPELRMMIETTGDTVDNRGSAYTSHLHRNLFAPEGTQEGAAIRAILKRARRGSLP